MGLWLFWTSVFVFEELQERGSYMEAAFFQTG